MENNNQQIGKCFLECVLKDEVGVRREWKASRVVGVGGRGGAWVRAARQAGAAAATAQELLAAAMRGPHQLSRQSAGSEPDGQPARDQLTEQLS